jgi:hypothetical protein
VPSKEVSSNNQDQNKFYTLEIDDIPISTDKAGNTTIEFFARGADNTVGLRLDNIKIIAKSN